MKYLTLIIIAIISISGCTEDITTPPIATAEAIVIAEMINSETGDPVSYQNFLVSFMIDSEDEAVSHGVAQTNEEGILETTLIDVVEQKGTEIIFTYGPENDRQSVSKEIEFDLKFDEPLDTLNLKFEI